MSNNSKVLEVINNFRKEHEDNALYTAVIDDILNVLSYDDYEHYENYIKEIVQHGCISGIVTSMIYYCDTEKFYKNYSLEILEEYKEYVENVGNPPDFEYTANNLAWFGYETVAYNLLNCIEETL